MSHHENQINTGIHYPSQKKADLQLLKHTQQLIQSIGRSAIINRGKLYFVRD